MFNLTRKSFQHIAQSMNMSDENMDEKIEDIHDVFSTPYIEGAMEEALSSFLNNLEWSVTDLVDAAEPELAGNWLKAISSFSDELERVGFDAFQVDVEDIAARSIGRYMDGLRESLRGYFSGLMSQVKDSEAANEVLDEFLHELIEGY